jgi:hypothetical protein
MYDILIMLILLSRVIHPHLFSATHDIHFERRCTTDVLKLHKVVMKILRVVGP